MVITTTVRPLQYSMGLEKNVRLDGCWITEWLFPCLSMLTVPYKIAELERMLHYRSFTVITFEYRLIKKYYLVCKNDFCEPAVFSIYHVDFSKSSYFSAL